jgi:hypothetical protein
VHCSPAARRARLEGDCHGPSASPHCKSAGGYIAGRERSRARGGSDVQTEVENSLKGAVPSNWWLRASWRDETLVVFVSPSAQESFDLWYDTPRQKATLENLCKAIPVTIWSQIKPTRTSPSSRLSAAMAAKAAFSSHAANICRRNCSDSPRAIAPGPIPRQVRASVCRHAACFDWPGPFVDFSGDKFGEVFRAPALDRRNILTNCLEAFADRREIKGGAQRLIKAPDDRFGGVHGELVNYAAIGIWNRPRQWLRQA